MTSLQKVKLCSQVADALGIDRDILHRILAHPDFKHLLTSPRATIQALVGASLLKGGKAERGASAVCLEIGKDAWRIATAGGEEPPRRKPRPQPPTP